MKNIHELDMVDRRIVAELQNDASLSNAELAERVGSSGPSCWRRIKALEAAGVFTQEVRLVDASKLGYGMNVLCNVRMRNHDSESIEAFEDFLRSHENIMECFSMSGEWDYLLRIVALDVADYEHFLMKTLLKHPSVAGASSHFALSVTKYKTAFPV